MTSAVKNLGILQPLKDRVEMIATCIKMYQWLLDLFVVDFFVDNHWDMLPKTWQTCFQDMDPQELSLLFSNKESKNIVPLSFLALIATVDALSVPRKKHNTSQFIMASADSSTFHPKLKNLFLKHVKLKKRHEIPVMASFISKIAEQRNCKAVIDFGSGLGHLIRVLSYDKGFHTAGIECQTNLIDEARTLDLELEYTAKKYLSKAQMDKSLRPIHINMKLSSNTQFNCFDLPKSMEEYGLVGLHPCGDLGPLLIKHFVSDTKVKFISLVGCCYMKLTCNADCGYPMSSFLKDFKCPLSYASRELACHAIEVYMDRLARGTYEDLMVHAYRAALELILVEQDPTLRHSLIRSVKHTDSLSFERYCELAVSRIGVTVNREAISRAKILLPLWRRVVVLYTLRLALAPLVESLILVDRLLFIMENGIQCGIEPVFDPKISPRNHIMFASR